MAKLQIPPSLWHTAYDEFFKAASLNGMPSCSDSERLGFALDAAIQWIDGQILSMRDAIQKMEEHDLSSIEFKLAQLAIIHNIRMLYMRDETPHEVLDLLWNSNDQFRVRGRTFDEAVIEAFKRGVEKGRA